MWVGGSRRPVGFRTVGRVTAKSAGVGAGGIKKCERLFGRVTKVSTGFPADFFVNYNFFIKKMR